MQSSRANPDFGIYYFFIEVQTYDIEHNNID